MNNKQFKAKIEGTFNNWCSCIVKYDSFGFPIYGNRILDSNVYHFENTHEPYMLATCEHCKKTFLLT